MTTITDIAEGQLNIEKIRKDFPILSTHVYGHPLVYLDNAATTQKPEAVLRAMDDYYHTLNSNVHRGVHYLSQQATEAYENSRQKIADFINARHNHEIIFTRGTTEAINLIAACFGRKFLGVGDSILISAVEHHSNIVPWQMICEERGATLRVIPVDDEGELVLADLPRLLEGVKLVSFNYVSNALGGINPVAAIVAAAHERGLPTDIAHRLTLETAFGAAQMARHSPDSLATLREQVTSKGGTTAAALEVLNGAGLRAIVAHAVAAADRRSAELAAEFGAP